jgi:hypothetical protein
MSKLRRRRIVLYFAIFGFLITGFPYALEVLHDHTKTPSDLAVTAGISSLVLCPPTLIFAACIDCEATGWDGFIKYSIAGGLNAAFYAVIGVGAAVWKKNAPGDSQS